MSRDKGFVGVNVDGEVKTHLPYPTSAYATLCGLDGYDFTTTQVNQSAAKPGKRVDCEDCWAIFQTCTQYRPSDFAATIAATNTETLPPSPRPPPKPREIAPREFDRQVREVVRLSVTGNARGIDISKIARLRAYDTERFDSIADEVRQAERKKVNPFNF